MTPKKAFMPAAPGPLQVEHQVVVQAARAADHHAASGGPFALAEDLVAMIGTTRQYGRLATAAYALAARKRRGQACVLQHPQDGLAGPHRQRAVAAGQRDGIAAVLRRRLGGG